jgi:ribose transport system permease protein
MTTTKAEPPQITQPKSLKQSISKNWSTLGPFVALIVLIAAFGIADQRFLQFDNGLNILRQSSVLLVLALASTFVILMGSIDLSVGSVLTLAAYSGALMVQSTGSTALLLLLPLIGLACGLFNGLLVAYGRLPSFLVTLGTLFAFNGLAKYLSSGRPLALPGGGVGDWFTGSIGVFPIATIWAIIVLAAAFLAARNTRFGRYLYALGGNEKTARLSGVPANRYKLYAFMVAGFLAGFAGLLQLTRSHSASPDMGESFLLPALAAVVMGGTALAGGIGGPLRTVTGVLIIAILTNGMVITAVNPFLQNMIQGLVVIAAVAVTMDRRKEALVK